MFQLLAVVLLLGFTIGLKIFPYKVLARRMPGPGQRVAEAWQKRRLMSHVRRAARIIPGGTCLPQAMTGYLLFSLMGLESRIQIGVARDPNKGFRAHATLMSGDHVVIGGGGDAGDFSHLADLRPGQ